MDDNTSSPAFWWVNQGTSYAEARAKGFLWAPKKNKAGNSLYHWENVSRVRAGDFVFHYAHGELRAISKANSDGYEAQKELGGGQWSDDGWRVDADYCSLTKPVPLTDIGSDLAALHLDKGPLDKTGGARQGYLFEIPAGAAELLIARIGDDPAVHDSGIDQVITVGKQERDATGLGDVCAKLLAGLEASSVHAEDEQVRRLEAALLSKPFMILTGLAGSGKTKLAQAIARWVTPDPGWIDAGDHSKGKHPNPYCALVPVGADWTGNENIVGYPDGLQEDKYLTMPALELIRHAIETDNADVPHFLILDEMNLSHVERYFADLLSAIESGEEIPLYEGGERTASGKVVPRRLRLPNNLFVIGTVNVDETTYMFSPKVLDRANVIEFRMEPLEMEAFLESPEAPRMESLDGKGASFGRAFVEAASDKELGLPDSVKSTYRNEMMLFFNLLKGHDAEFGYRTGYEAGRFVHFYKLLGGYSDSESGWFDDAMDAVIVQKFLPKLHGSRSRLEGLLWALAWACGAERDKRDGKEFPEQLSEAGKAEDEGKYGPEVVWTALKAKNASDPTKAARYPLSFDKVMRMWRKLVRDQFVSFAEA
jgi:5-methylcytosine-specific restriction protein B